MRMWNMNLVEKYPITMNTQDDIQEVIRVSPSRKMVATKSTQSIELQDTVTSEIIRHIDYKDDVEIAFSPDEN